MRGRVSGRTSAEPTGLRLGWCGAVALGIAAGRPCRASGQEPILLRLAPSIGQVSRYQYEMQMWVQISGLPAGDSTTPSMRSTFSVTQTVTRVDGEIRELRLSYDSVRFEAPMMGAMAQPMAQQAAESMRGLVVTTRMDARGRVLSTAMTGGTTPTPGPFSMMAGRQIPLPVLPTRSVTVGTTWTDSETVTDSDRAREMRTTTRVTYRLERLDTQAGCLCATIRATGTFASYGAEAPMHASGSVASEVVLDLALGRLVRARSSTDVTTDLPQTGQRIPMRLTVTGVLVPQSEGPR